MNEDILKNHIKEDKSGKCYLFCGDEEYTKDHYIKQLLKRVNSMPMPEFNLTQYNEKSFSAHALSASLEELPYMSDYKLIVVEDANLSKLTESTVAEVCDVMDNMPEYANVLFVARRGELSAKLLAKKEKAAVSKLIDYIEKNGLVVTFETQTGVKLKKWVKRHFDAANTPISDEALEHIIALCGEDMYTLHGEAAKLIAYCNGRTVEKKDVNEVCCANETFRVFDLTKALTAGNTQSVHEIYGGLIKSGSSPFMIINLLSSCITDMTVVKSGIESGKTVQEIAKTLKTFDWAVRNYIPYVKRTSYKYLEYAAAKCNECALALKSYRTDAACDIEFFLLKLAAYEEDKA